MPPVDNVNVIRVRGYLQYQDGTPIPRQRVVTVPVSSVGKAVLQVTDISSGLFVALKATSTLPDQTTGYFYIDLVASNDPDLAPSFLWAITVGQAAPVLVTVPYNAPTSVVDGGSRQWVWLADLPVQTTPTPTGLTYYTSVQTDAAIAEAIADIPIGGGAVDSVNGRTGVVVGLSEASDLSAHVSDHANPHVVTKSQVGLGNADNTGDVNKPVSSATQTALNLKANTSSLATVATSGAYVDLSGKPTIPATKADIGLGNVDNTSDATKNSASVTLTNKTLTTPVINSPTGLVKADVGLGSVDNTADTAKPVSTAQQTALDGKQPLDSDLSTIAGLTATTNNMIQSVGSAWASRTPAQVKTALAITESDVTNLVSDLAAKQSLDSDLTAIAALTATTDNFLQSKASTWASRTPAQVAADLVTPLSSSLQSLDSDLTTIAGLTATTDSFLQSKASAWTTRTIAQVKSDLAVPTVPSDIGAQPVDSDLTTIAGLTATTDNVLQSVAGAWASRTPAQVKAALVIAEADVTGLVADLAAKAALLVPGANITSSGTATAGTIELVDTTSGSVVRTLPSAPADKTQILIKHVIQGGTNTVSVTCGGTDTFNRTGGGTTTMLATLGQATWVQYKASAGFWIIIGSDLALSQLDLRYAAIGASGTPSKAVTTSEALTAGDWVNLWTSTGIKARRADASTSGKRAHGYVTAAVISGGTATVYTGGINTAVSGATPGSDAFLSDSTPGGYVSTAPTGSGKTVQYLGPILSATEIAFEPTIPMVLA